MSHNIRPALVNSLKKAILSSASESQHASTRGMTPFASRVAHFSNSTPAEEARKYGATELTCCSTRLHILPCLRDYVSCGNVCTVLGSSLPDPTTESMRANDACIFVDRRASHGCGVELAWHAACMRRGRTAPMGLYGIR